jgi:hypothetical protein
MSYFLGAEQLARLQYDYMTAYLGFFDPKGSTAEALRMINFTDTAGIRK